MNANVPLEFLASEQLEEIFARQELENEKIENRVKLMEEWLGCETHLPSIVDKPLLKNFIYGSKANLEKTKMKFEKYLIAKSKMTPFFRDREIKPHEHVVYPQYKCFYASRKQSQEGNRVIVMRIPLDNTHGFDFLVSCKYMILGFDFLLYHDNSVAYDFIYDAGNFTGPIISKINFTVAKNIFEVLYNILPYRTKSISVINLTPGFEIFMNIAKPLMPKKIKDRIRNVTIEDLPKILPLECLPEDYGGRAEKLDDRTREIFGYLNKNKGWCRETESLKLVGSLPEDKKGLYSFEEFCMDGSFRKLTID